MRGWWSLLIVLAVLAMTAAPAAVRAHNLAAVPNVTGVWEGKGDKVPTWHLVASGPGLSHLHATWSGVPGSGHENLHGVFDGTLSGSAYTGDFVITELATRGTGTMTFLVVNANHLTITLTPAGRSPQTYTLIRAPQQGGTSVDANFNINISYFANALPTAPPSGGGRCPAAVEAAHVSGEFEAHLTTIPGPLNISGGGNVVAKPLDTHCRVPNLQFFVDDIAVSVSGTTITAVFTVHASGTSNTQPGQCEVPFTGTITATENDAVSAANGLTANTLKFGPWSKPCNAFMQTITNNISSITADSAGSTWVRVWIGCWNPDKQPGTGYSPRNCLGG